MTIPKITESMIRAGASPESFRCGEEYYRGSAISNTFIQGMLVSGECAGTYAPAYRWNWIRRALPMRPAHASTNKGVL